MTQAFATADSLLDVAERRLLAAFDLESAALARVFGVLGAHRIDDADLYFQDTQSEGWSLEEGIVKSGSFTIDRGVGVRAIAGEKTAFAYSDEISLDALDDAARATRAIARAGQNRRVQVVPRHANRRCRCRSTRRPTRSPRSRRRRRSRCSSGSSACAARATRASAR